MLLLLLLTIALAYQPDCMNRHRKMEGWYSRLTDDYNSVSVIFGWNKNISTMSQIVMLVYMFGEEYGVETQFIDEFNCQTFANGFEIKSQGFSFRLDGNKTNINYENKKFLLKIVSYHSVNLETYSIDNYLDRFAAAITAVEWKVFSISSPSVYEFKTPFQYHQGKGLTHFEYNTGIFPPGWIWIQVSDSQMSIVLAMGHIYGVRVWRGRWNDENISPSKFWTRLTWKLNSSILTVRYFYVGIERFNLEIIPSSQTMELHCPVMSGGFFVGSEQSFNNVAKYQDEYKCMLLKSVALELGGDYREKRLRRD